MNNNVYNVGLSNANISKLELCQIIKKYVSDFVYIDEPIGKDPDQRNYIVSNEKIEKTGFIPEVSIDDGVQELIKGFAMIRNNFMVMLMIDVLFVTPNSSKKILSRSIDNIFCN